MYRVQTECRDSNDRVQLNAAFQSYLERVQQSVAYVRRTGTTANPDNQGLGIVGQSSKSQPGKPGAQSVGEVDQVAWQGEVGEEQYGEKFIKELDEEMIAYVQEWENERFTQFVDAQMIAEAGGAGSKLCFLCRCPFHLARNCGMRMKNLSQAMSRMGGTQRGGMRGGRRWRGRGHRGDAVARWEVSLLTCLQLPPQTFDPSPQVRPSTSANSRIFRKVYE